MAFSLVTGTSTGIGFATAVALGRAGRHAYATMRNPDRSPELLSIAATERLPIKVLRVDVDDDASVRETIAAAVTDSGQIDVLVNNAGIPMGGSVEELPLSEFRHAMETNYFGVLRCLASRWLSWWGAATSERSFFRRATLDLPQALPRMRGYGPRSGNGWQPGIRIHDLSQVRKAQKCKKEGPSECDRRRRSM
jgi:NAD(P)-dependent dehydrogenase (short-subunit alcohol dehydrogenase family)